jgi:predicted amidohydrolase
MSTLNIAGLQLALDNNNQALSDNNFDIIQQQIDTTMLRFPWIDLIVLSELAGYGVKQQYAQEQNGAFEQLFCQLAKKHNIWLVPGSYLESKGSTTYNTAPIIDPTGKVIKRYRKIYQFLP